MKNKISKKNQKQIENIREMLAGNQHNFDKNPDKWASFKQSWEEIIKELEAGVSF